MAKSFARCEGSKVASPYGHYVGPPSALGRLIKPVARVAFGLLLGGNKIDIDKSRKRLNLLGSIGGIPDGITRRHVGIQGQNGALKAEWLLPTDVADNSPVILYLHGGGYISGSIVSHRDLASRLALAAEARCLILDYRLAPEAPFPAALEDSISSWHWLKSQGIQPEQIIIAGDSAGGGLALATGLRLKELGERQPAGYYCLCPWTDLTLSGQSITERRAREIVLANPQLLPTASAAYVASESPEHPLISPLWGSRQGLAPLLIHVGTEEILLDDALRLHQRAIAAGAESELKIWVGMWHVWPLLYRLGLPEARAAMVDAAEFIRANTCQYTELRQSDGACTSEPENSTERTE